jgi:hypothetical protein
VIGNKPNCYVSVYARLTQCNHRAPMIDHFKNEDAARSLGIVAGRCGATAKAGNHNPN